MPDLSRRLFLRQTGLLLAAPAIIRVADLMPVHVECPLRKTATEVWLQQKAMVKVIEHPFKVAHQGFTYDLDLDYLVVVRRHV